MQKILPAVEVAVVAKQGQPGGDLQGWGVIYELSHLGACRTPTPSALSRLLLPKNSGNVVHFHS